MLQEIQSELSLLFAQVLCMDCRFEPVSDSFTGFIQSVVVKEATLEGISITECLLTRSVFQLGVMPLVSLCRNCFIAPLSFENKFDALKQNKLDEFLCA